MNRRGIFISVVRRLGLQMHSCYVPGFQPCLYSIRYTAFDVVLLEEPAHRSYACVWPLASISRRAACCGREPYV